MSKKISLENFLRMTPDAPQYTDKNQHYLISGANPTYYNDSAVNIGGFPIAIQEEQIAPLASSHTWDTTRYSIGSNRIVADVTESTVSDNDVYTIDIDSTVFGINITTNTLNNYGFPSGSTKTANKAKLKCFSGRLLVIPNDSTSFIWYMTLPSSGWGHFGSIIYDQDHFMENFLEYCMYCDGTQIKKIDSSWNTTNGIDLGAGWKFTGLLNYNNKYMAISATQGSFAESQLFLWDGISDTYNYSVQINGQFIDMIVIEGTLYIAVNENGGNQSTGYGKTSIYYLKGTQLVKLFTPQISTISRVVSSITTFKGALFNYQNKLGINLFSTDQMIYADSPGGKEEFIISTGIPFFKFSNTFSGNLFAIAQQTVSTFNLSVNYYYNFLSSTYNQITYKSHWIPVKNLQGIDIWYDSPPQSGTDKISVTVYADGQDIITGTQTITLDDITPTNQLNEKRTRLDVKGFAGDKCKIVLTTTNTGSWRPIIRQIDLITK